MEEANPAEQPISARRKKRRRFVFAVMVLFIILVAMAPWIIGKTSLRNQIFALLVDDPQLQVTSTDASLGWLSPMTIDNLEIKSTNRSMSIRVDQVKAEKSWFFLWLDRPDLGKLQVTGPQIELIVDPDDEEESTIANPDDETPTRLPRLNAIIKNATLSIREQGQTEPAVDLRKVDFTFRIEHQDAGPMLIVDPLQIFDRLELTESFCNQGLQLIVPMIADEVSVKGHVSLELTQLKISLESSPEEHVDRGRVEVEGVVTLHKVSAGIKNSITRRLLMLAADLLDLGKLPERIQITDNSQLKFHLQDGLLHHQGIGIFFPDISPDFTVQTSGSVGIDEQLNLKVVLQFPSKILGDSPLAKKLAATPLVVQVTGQLDKPKLGIPTDQKWISGLSDHLMSDELTKDDAELAGKLIKMIAKLLQESDGTQVQIPDELMERIKQAK